MVMLAMPQTSHDIKAFGRRKQKTQVCLAYLTQLMQLTCAIFQQGHEDQLLLGLQIACLLKLVSYQNGCFWLLWLQL